MQGSPQGDGSAGQPWRTLQEVMEANLVETQEWDQLPYAPSSQLVPKNAGAPVKAGDTIWLRSGYHGEVLIERSYNASAITIAAEAGQTPELRSLHLRAAGHWTIRGLSISPEHAPTYDPVQLVYIETHDHSGPSHDVIIEGCEMFSVADGSGWSMDDWNNLPCNGVRVAGDHCTIVGNHLTNVDFGITVSGEHALVERNVIENFAGDGLRGLGDHDGVGTGEVVGVVLRGNTIINYEDPNQPFVGTLQGIGCFDGMFVDWVVENNVIITDHWHGITLSGARNSRIVNNTVMDRNDADPGPPWIRISEHKDGTLSEGCLVRNNLTTALNSQDGSGVTVDTNIIIEDPSEHFVDHAGFDLHLIESSEAIDSASTEQAPAADRDEIPRPQGPGIDVGAYEYYEGEPVYPDAGTDGGGAGSSIGGGSAGGAGGAGANGSAATPESEGDCGCRTVGPAKGPGPALGFLLLLLAVGVRRSR